jgi:hypothetical protein
MGRGPVIERIAPFKIQGCPRNSYAVLANLSASYPPLNGRLTTRYSPVCHSYCYAFDLHVLGTPPALILSQDQTLHKFLMELLKALLIADMEAFNRIATDEGFLTRLRIGLARLDLTIGSACHSSLYGRCSQGDRWSRNPERRIDRSSTSVRRSNRCSQSSGQQKTRLSPRNLPAGS